MKYSIALVSGLGNIVLSLAGFYHVLKKSDIDPRTSAPLLDWIDKPYENGYLFGGHPRKRPITLDQIFPLINFSPLQKSLKDPEINFSTYFCNDFYYADHFKRLIELTRDKNTEWMVVIGWFFHPDYRPSRHRSEIIEWLSFGDVVKDRVHSFFHDNNITPETTISFHCRLGSPRDHIKLYVVERDTYLHGLKSIKEQYPEMDTVLVCSESRERFEQYMDLSQTGLRYVFYDEDPENCLYAMKECAHHIVSNSTLSYSVLYLDEKFPQRSLAYGSNFDYANITFVDPEFISRDHKTGLVLKLV